MRRTRLKRSNSARRRKAYTRDFGPQAALCRTLPCSCGCGRMPCQPHHEPPRSSYRSQGDADTVPLHWECHAERHIVGVTTFWTSRGKDPEAVKAAVRSMMR